MLTLQASIWWLQPKRVWGDMHHAEVLLLQALSVDLVHLPSPCPPCRHAMPYAGHVRAALAITQAEAPRAIVHVFCTV